MKTDTPRTVAKYAEVFAEDDHEAVEKMNAFAQELERELNFANERIRLLISERDSARQQAEQHWRLREEFQALLGTDDVAEGVKRVKAQQERIKRLEEAGDQMFWACNDEDLCAVWCKAKEAKP